MVPSVSPSGVPTSIPTTFPTEAPSASSAPSQEPTSEEERISANQANEDSLDATSETSTGIIAGAVIGASLVAAGVVFIAMRMRNNSDEDESQNPEYEPSPNFLATAEGRSSGSENEEDVEVTIPQSTTSRFMDMNNRLKQALSNDEILKDLEEDKEESEESSQSLFREPSFSSKSKTEIHPTSSATAQRDVEIQFANPQSMVGGEAFEVTWPGA